MSDDLTALIWAPLLTGFAGGALVSLVAAFVGWLVSAVVKRKARRRQIISLMARAVALQARAINDGRFDRAYVENSTDPVSAVREKYDDLTAQALDLFQPGEDVVAFWTAVEFHAGWADPLSYLREKGTPREDPGPGGYLLTTNHLAGGWRAARPELLAQWAQVRWPWDRGNARGPRYADIHTAGDRTRHHIVIPNSDVNADLLKPFIWYIRTPKTDPFRTPTPAETKRLDEEWEPRNEQWANEREQTTGKRPRFPPRTR